MRQVLQSLKTGEIELIKAPAPRVRPRHVLIETRRSLISAGTERMLLEFGKGNLIEKALQQPDKVKQTLEKVKADGVTATLDAVRSKLDQPIPLGYCNAGRVAAVGADVTHVKVGDRVVSNAPHAELVVVGRNLVAKIPDGVTDEAAAYTPLAAIALQGCRLSRPELGETFCVMGLGLIGLLSVQLLRASGARVIGADFSKDRLALARQWGAETVDLSAGEDPVASAMAATGGAGVDGVIIAAATKYDDVIAQAAQMSRQRGRIVLVGVIGLNLSRADFYEKELTFQVSCSYGPGRYDPSFEVDGVDYPAGFVRWTEQRNFEAVLAEMAAGRLDVTPLISEMVSIDMAASAYARLTEKGGNDLGLVLAYPEDETSKFAASVQLTDRKSVASTGVVALIGAGGFAGRFTAPGLKSAGADLKTIVSRGGVSGVLEGRKAGFENASSDPESAFVDPDIDTVVIATRHDSHADLVQRALKAGKHVFVEKPLALNEADLDAIKAQLDADESRSCLLTVGFNRRFSAFSQAMKTALDTVQEPKTFIATINAGEIPPDHWTHDPVQGGGRIVGEACHFIDLLAFFAGAPIIDVQAIQIGRPTADGIAADKATISLAFEDGSIGTVHYFANGPKTLAKERFEAFSGGRYLKLDNFKALDGIGWSKPIKHRGKQDKGQAAILKAFIDAVKSGGPAPIPRHDLLSVSRWTLRAADLARAGAA